ncbi:MAG: TRAP transporter small permease [Pseudomonadota bacterium]|nr:TRAP transporter small permease [Pseudomonadota bacterium]
MPRILHIIDTLNDWLARGSAVILGLMTILILVEIGLWNTLEVTTLVADEYSAYGLAAIIFLGAGYTLKEKGHIRITLVLNLLPNRFAALITALATSVTTFFIGYLVWQLYRMTVSTHHYGSTSGTLTATPLWIPQTIVVIGAVIFTLQIAAESLRAWQQFITPQADKSNP